MKVVEGKGADRYNIVLKRYVVNVIHKVKLYWVKDKEVGTLQNVQNVIKDKGADR